MKTYWIITRKGYEHPYKTQRLFDHYNSKEAAISHAQYLATQQGGRHYRVMECIGQGRGKDGVWDEADGPYVKENSNALQ